MVRKQLHKWQLQLLLALVISVFLGCSSSPQSESAEKVDTQPVIKVDKQDNSIKNILAHPQIYVGRTITVSGQIAASEIREVSKDIALMTVKLRSAAQIDKFDMNKTKSKYDFIDKLREAEDLVAGSRYKDVRLLSSAAPKLYESACDLKVSSSRLEALAHYYEGLGKKQVAISMKQLSKGLSYIGDSYLSFQKAALASSPEAEKDLSEENLLRLQKFEESLLRSSGLMQVFADELEKTRDVISLGYYTFNANKKLNTQRGYEILTYGSLLKGEAWKMQKAGDDEFFNIATVLSEGMQTFGKGDNFINAGLKSLSETLNKTAVSATSESMDSLRCAYYGFNRSHLRRCLNTLNRLDRDVEIKIKGELRRSNLREEVDVLWLQASTIEVDGVSVALNYGDENETIRSAMELYEWAEEVKNGK